MFTTPDTTYFGKLGHTYTFYGSAVDNVGYKEVLKQLGRITITGNQSIGSAILFTSNLDGTNYQWQVNNGGSFVNITTEGIYDSIMSKILVINNAPGNLNGYQYWAMVNGSPSQVYTIQFTNSWQGSVSNAWENPENWSCRSMPDQHTIVTIPSNKQRYPLINSNVVVKNLTLNPRSSAVVNAGFTVTVLK